MNVLKMWSIFLSFLLPIAATAANLPHKTLFSFPNTTYYDIENIAVRSNGDLLLNLLSEPSIYTLSPSTKNATLLHTFPNATKLDGIVEYQPDIFAVVAGNALSNGTSTYAIWSTNFTAKSQPRISKILDVPGASALNGLTTLTGSFSDTLLIADAKLGAIWIANTTSKTSQIAYKSPYFLPTTAIAFGINGIHTYREKIYFSTSANNSFGYIDEKNGTVQIIAYDIASNKDYDDFALDKKAEYAYVAAHSENLVRINVATGEQEIVVSGLNNPTAAAFGRGREGEYGCVLNVVTQGSSSNGTIASGGVVEVNICQD